MTQSLENVMLQLLGALLIALVSAWLTVRLSLRRFRLERLWDRKAQSYERVLEAFHKSKKFSFEHLRAWEHGRELTDERDKELRRLAHEALEEILRVSDVGSFTLSSAALELIEKYRAESDNENGINSWYEHLEHDFAVTKKYMDLVVAEAKRDLAQ